ncbi:phage tail sheath C-terminal domain-containing protein [Klebsiella aerogenes]
MAGVYCRNDVQNGPWRTPANVSLQGVTPVVRITNQEQTENLTRLNMIRDLYKRPAVVFGGRTQNDSDEWRYISSRRLYQMISRDIDRVLQNVVFYPNTAKTWNKVQSELEAYLSCIWNRGGLVGENPTKSFFVRVGEGITMSSTDILNGIMNVEIGFSPVKPNNFIILRFSQFMAID